MSKFVLKESLERNILDHFYVVFGSGDLSLGVMLMILLCQMRGGRAKAQRVTTSQVWFGERKDMEGKIS